MVGNIAEGWWRTAAIATTVHAAKIASSATTVDIYIPNTTGHNGLLEIKTVNTVATDHCHIIVRLLQNGSCLQVSHVHPNLLTI